MDRMQMPRKKADVWDRIAGCGVTNYEPWLQQRFGRRRDGVSEEIWEAALATQRDAMLIDALTRRV